MKINEIFESIDGEGLRTGELVTFIRLAGCNLRCSYCDTPYALKGSDGTEMSIEKIIEHVKAFKSKKITLTGGEPLIHENVDSLIAELKDYEVNIETNGSVDIGPYISSPNVIVTMDYKTKSSGENKKMLLSNLEKLRETDVLKIVMSEEDKADVFELLNEHEIKSYIYLSPIFEKCDPADLVSFLKFLQLSGINVDKIRVQVQLHKIIWDPNKRGV